MIEVGSTAVDEARLLTGITAICGVIEQERDLARLSERTTVEAIRTVVERVKSSYEEESSKLRARINDYLLPEDPLRQTWNVFRAFGVEHTEPYWTQWLAALLRSENGECCARVAWGAFCDAVARRAAASPPMGASNLADHVHWMALAMEIPHVEDEVSGRNLGTLDMLITTPSIIAAVENKLWADWHDGPKRPQADRYREIAKQRLGEDPHRRLGLVLLSEREGLQRGDYPADYIHVRWWDLGQALRRALRREWSKEQSTAIELWPIVLTLVSIEQDLLRLSLVPKTFDSRSLALRALAELATYLEGA